MQRFNNNMREKAVEMAVKYRFKSSIEFSTVLFSGSYISVGDLRKEITKQKRLAPNADYELQIMNAETKHVYEFDPTLIPANTNLIVSRIPVVAKASSRENEIEKNNSPQITQISPQLPSSVTATSNQFSDSVHKTYYQYDQNNHVENTNADYNYSGYYGNDYSSNDGYNYGSYEEQSEGYNYYDYEYGYSNTDPNTTAEPNPNLAYIPVTTTNTTKSHRFVPYMTPYSRKTSKDDVTSTDQTTVVVNSGNGASWLNNGQTQLSTSPTGNDNSFKSRKTLKFERPVPPASYKCFKCNQSGHWIKHCPILEEHIIVKKSTGIPRSQMIIVNDHVDGAYVTPEGRYAVPVTHMEAYAKRQ